MRRLHRSLAFRVLTPIIVFALALGAAAIVLTRLAVAELVEQQIANDLRWRAQNVFQIIDSNFDELQRTGRGEDDIAVRHRKVNSLMQIEDFARANELKVSVYDTVEQRATELGSDLAPPAAGTGIARALYRLSGSDVAQYAHALRFEPWRWEITLRQDNRAYQTLLSGLSWSAGTGVLIFVLGLAAFMTYLTVLAQRPIRSIVSDLEKNQPPKYQGIAEFEYLGQSIATMMSAIRQQSQLLETTFAHMADGLCVFDGELRCLTCNGRFLALYGLAETEGGIDQHHDAPATRALLRDVLGHAQPAIAAMSGDLVIQHRHADGRTIEIEISRMSEDRYISTHIDVSERRRAEIEREARLAAEAANEAKSAFLAKMSHELRTPMNAILGYAQIIGRSRNLDEREAAGVATIMKSGDHLLTLIDDILDLARVESGKLDLYPEALDLMRFVQGVADIILVRAQQKNIGFVYEAAPDLPEAVAADEKRLRQVLLNLLGNAVKFTDRGQVTLRTRVLVHDSAAGSFVRVRFEIEDTGIGIDRKQLDALFQPFQQVGDLERRRGGTGLGLAISRQLVRLMGSDIEVASEPGRGSRFWFDLRLPIAQLARVSTATARVPIGYTGPRRSVLVVDDIVENRAMVADMLRPLGFNLIEAVDGAEGVERAQAEKPDVILMDNLMPVIDGLQATRLLRALPAFADVPIIAISASAAKADQEKAMAAGSSAFLPKPFRAQALLKLLEQHLHLQFVYK
jgi:signal transduction histidine kinase/ActR/RegA family two-component response regulator